MCAIVQHARVQWKWQPDRQHPLKTVLDGAVMYVTYNHLSKVMRDLSKNDPARMVRYVRRFGHLWLAQHHPKPVIFSKDPTAVIDYYVQHKLPGDVCNCPTCQSSMEMVTRPTIQLKWPN
jgi:hypothetical protein